MVISENIQRLPTFGRLEGYTDTRFQAFLTNEGSIPSTRSTFQPAFPGPLGNPPIPEPPSQPLPPASKSLPKPHQKAV